jgi:hypothetical protein
MNRARLVKAERASSPTEAPTVSLKAWWRYLCEGGKNEKFFILPIFVGVKKSK